MYKSCRILIIMMLLFGSACTTQKELVYLSNIDTLKAPAFFPYSYPDYKIQKRDILYIRFFTMNDELSDILNTTSARYTANMYQNETSLYINGYTVNDSGYVLLPLLGEIGVVGLTVDEATRIIQERTNDFLKDGTVVVKLISFKVTVIGEVNRPGTYTNFNNQLTVLEAIATIEKDLKNLEGGSDMAEPMDGFDWEESPSDDILTSGEVDSPPEGRDLSERGDVAGYKNMPAGPGPEGHEGEPGYHELGHSMLPPAKGSGGGLLIVIILAVLLFGE